MKNWKLFVTAAAVLMSPKIFADNLHTDKAGDVDHSIKSMCHDLQTDMVSNEFTRDGDKYVVKMTMAEDIQKDYGYKEYYFWLDVDPEKRKGYQPYDPESVAWPDMYADYRIFMSLDANNDDHIAWPRIMSQDCIATDCSKDEGMRYADDIKVDIAGKTVTFSWPVGLFSKMDAAKVMKLGYTTYYEMGACHGEDDSPDWGNRAWVIKKSAVTTPVPAPPAPKPL